MKSRPTAVLALIALFSLATAAPVVFHLSPTGNDRWSGLLATPNAQKSDGPFATPERARDAVREAKKKSGGPFEVRIQDGVYPLAATLSFNEEDSGTPQAPLRWVAAAGSRPVFTGGRPIKAVWSKTPGKPYYQATVAEARDGKWPFHFLYVNGISKTRARKPNEDQVMLRGKGRVPGESSNGAFEYFPGDLDPAWRNPDQIDLVLINAWTPTLHTGLRFDAPRNVVKFESTHIRPVDFFERRFRYYVANVFEALDYPGEWYLDRKAGILFYYPEAGENMASAEVIAPVVKTRLLECVAQDPAKPLSYLEFHGIAFSHAEGDLETHNGKYRQGHMFLGSGVYARNFRRGMFSNCEFSRLGEYAMELDAGCQENRVVQCHFYDIGAGGIQIGITDLKTLKDLEQGAPGQSVRVLSNTVENCLVHRLGTLWHGCYGLLNRFASYSRIVHNEVFDVHWDAIASDARWEYRGERWSGGHEIAYNYLHDLGLGYHGDAAGYYQFGPLDTWVHHNIVHDTVAYPYIHAGFAGYYLDEMSRGAVVENNLAYRLDWSAFNQNWGSNNIFRNNIGAFSRDGFITRGGIQKSGRNDFEAHRNIFLSSNRIAISSPWEPGKVPPTLSQNLYWSTTAGEDLRFFGDLDLRAFQAKGYDEGSLIADPGFKDPLRGDFSLDPKNPVLKKIGFVPFDGELRKAGLTGDPAWKSLASRYTKRKPIPVEDGRAMAKLSRVEMDFEDQPAGSEPSAFTIRKEKDATFSVTEEEAAGGRRSLKCQDRKDITKNFNPHLFAGFNLTEGAFRMAFDFKISRKEPIELRAEIRGKGSVGETGPRVDLLPDGSVVAGGRTIGQVPVGEWGRIEMRFDLGASAGTWKFELKHGAKVLQEELPFVNSHFKSVTWAGIISGQFVDGVAFIDNLVIGPD
jgi:hypothetical protein